MGDGIRNKLFVFGHARSGTTIMGRLLNSADEVLLLGEAHLFESYWNRRFVADFNARHLRTKRIKSKGVRLPTQLEGMLPEEVLRHFGPHYQFVGEKIAIGPMSGLGTRAASAALDYYQAYHLDGSYVLTFRAPVPSLASLAKLFPRVPLAALLQGWMLSLVEIGAAGHVLKRVILAPLELMSFEYWQRIEQKLGIAGRAEASWMNPNSASPACPATQAELAARLAGELGWDQAAAAAFLDRLTQLYAIFVERIDPETLFYRRSVSFAAQVAERPLSEVHAMAGQLAATGAASTLPASVCGWLSGGTLSNDRRVLPMPDERLHRFAAILRDSLFCAAAATVLTDPASPHELIAHGIDLRRDGAWLRLTARPDAGHHRHLTAHMPIEPLAIATTRLRLRRQPGHARFLMLQAGNTTGFCKAVFDCDGQRVTEMAAFGEARIALSQIDMLANGDLRLAMSGLLAPGKDSYLRLYMCDETGAIDFTAAAPVLEIDDWVLGYGPQECGLA